MTDKLRGNYTNTISVGGEITVTKELDEDKTSMDSSIRSNSSLAQTALTETNIIANGGSYTSDWTERTGPEMLIAISTDQDLDYYAEFSPDGINNDSSLPYTYDASGINPPRRLVIARKFWRIRIVNNSGSDLTYLRAQVSIGDFDPLSSKINATIDDQSDSVVSRAITTGKDPNNNYVNVSADGYVDAFGTTTALDNGEVFDSGIVDLSGYQSLKTEVASDQDGTIVGTWYDDAAGTNIIRTFTLPYSASETLSVTGTIILGKYLRYTFTNDSGVNQNRLYFNVRLSNVSMSGQILKVEQFVPTNVLTQLNRSILVGKKSSGVYGNVGINDANALEVSDFLFGVTRGEFSGFNIDTKFGYNPDIDIGSVPEDIWGPGGLYTGQPIHSASAETVAVQIIMILLRILELEL